MCGRKFPRAAMGLAFSARTRAGGEYYESTEDASMYSVTDAVWKTLSVSG